MGHKKGGGGVVLKNSDVKLDIPPLTLSLYITVDKLTKKKMKIHCKYWPSCMISINYTALAPVINLRRQTETYHFLQTLLFSSLYQFPIILLCSLCCPYSPGRFSVSQGTLDCLHCVLKAEAVNR